jgi:hypothetical protein
MRFWKETVQLYRRCKLARDGEKDFFALKSKWLLQGIEFRTLVEPLDIANWYKAGNTASSGHYADAILEGEDGQRPSTYHFLEALERERLPEGAAVKDSVAKAAQYKRLFEEGKLEVQGLAEARADPPRGFKKQPPPASSPVPAAVSTGMASRTHSEHFLSRVMSRSVSMCRFQRT